MPSVDERHRLVLTELVGPSLAPGETIEAILPFATVPKRPRGPDGKVREGLWQSTALHRPLVLTDRALYVFDAGRTPFPRFLIATYARDALRVVDVRHRRLSTRTVTVSIPGEGDVPFEVGTKDDVEVFVASLASATS